MNVPNLIFCKINNFYFLDTNLSPVSVCVLLGLFVCLFFLHETLMFSWQLLSQMITLGEAELEIFSSCLVQVFSDLQ